jgi:hypothetical protein
MRSFMRLGGLSSFGLLLAVWSACNQPLDPPGGSPTPSPTGSPAPTSSPAPTESPAASPMPDFAALDVNPNSLRHNEPVSPRDYLETVSAWYFGHAT